MPSELSENRKTHAGERERIMVHHITSASNPLIKTLKGLHAKKGRAESGLFLAEGARLTLEATDLGIWPAIMVYAPAALERPRLQALIDEAERRRVRVIETSESVLGQITKRDNPQTVIGAYEQRLSALDEIAGATVVALEGVRDPGNLGTILRTADSVGAAGVVLVGECCDPFSVEAVRASMGSLFAVTLARASFDELLEYKRQRNTTLIGASLNGRHFGEEIPAPAQTVLLMGNEQSGLSDEIEANCDLLVRLPMRGRADSLNLAIATGVLLYDLWRRRGYDGARA
jgi:TrmH family RNA methyltransferase